MTQLALVDAYQTFLDTAKPYVSIVDEQAYREAVQMLERVLESAADTPDDPLNPLIDMLSHAIEVYESKDTEVAEFLAQAEGIPADIALLRTLMSQHKLTGNDLPEIGDKTMVSKVLNGKRVLSRQAIEKLSVRFGVRASQFFGESN